MFLEASSKTLHDLISLSSIMTLCIEPEYSELSIFSIVVILQLGLNLFQKTKLNQKLYTKIKELIQFKQLF
mgnify:FL=1